MSKYIFNLRRFLSGTITFGVLNTSLICVVLVPFFKDSGILPLQLSMLILMKKLGRLLFDSVFGLLFDRFGAKKVFFIGRVSKLISFVILLQEPSFKVFALSMLFDGISYSAMYGKIGAFIYNTLSAHEKLNFYTRAMSVYYFSTSVFISSASFLAALLLKYYGYNLLIQISIILNILSILILLFIIPSNKENKVEKFVSRSVKDIIITIKILIKRQPQFLYLLFFYGLVNFLSWQFGSISAMILMDMGLKSSAVVSVGATCKVILAVGCCLSYFLSNGIKIKKCTNIFTCFVAFAIVTAVLYNEYIMMAFMYSIVLIYTTIEVSIEKNLDRVSDKRIRGTAISLAMTFCNIFTMASLALVGFIAQYFSYHTAFVVITIIVSAITLFVVFKLRRFDKIVSEMK